MSECSNGSCNSDGCDPFSAIIFGIAAFTLLGYLFNIK